MKFLLAFIVVGVLAACAPSLKRTGYAKPKHPDASCPVLFVRPDTLFRNDSIFQKLGSLRIRAGKFDRPCAEEDILPIIRAEACSQRGNLVAIREIQPGFWNKCFRGDASILKVQPDSLDRLDDRYYDEYGIERRSRRQRADQAGAVVSVVSSLLISTTVLILTGTGVIK